ncbi:hypothetical protein [Nocardiopsis alba]|uniref:hypothetical protein n=1 Tax=Nocardiopsis alba TaxID=53437 RepID=UPI0033AB2FB3
MSDNDKPVWVVRLGYEKLAFWNREDAATTALAWNETYARVSDPNWMGGEPVQFQDWTWAFAPSSVWTRAPKRQLIHYRRTAFLENGEEAPPAPFAVGADWVFEWQADSYTTRAAVDRVVPRPGPGVRVEASARGMDETAVAEAFKQACREAQERARRLTAEADDNTSDQA